MRRSHLVSLIGCGLLLTTIGGTGIGGTGDAEDLGQARSKQDQSLHREVAKLRLQVQQLERRLAQMEASLQALLQNGQLAPAIDLTIRPVGKVEKKRELQPPFEVDMWPEFKPQFGPSHPLLESYGRDLPGSYHLDTFRVPLTRP